MSVVFLPEAIALFLGLFFAQEKTPLADQPRTVKPVLVWTGTDSSVSKRQFFRVENPEAWEKTLKEHSDSGTDRPMDAKIVPDFDGYSVLAIFDGKNLNNRGIEIVSIVEKKESVLIRYRLLSFQTGDNVKFTQSYCFVLLQRTKKPVVVEQDVRDLIRMDPVWKVRATLKSTNVVPTDK